MKERRVEGGKGGVKLEADDESVKGGGGGGEKGGKYTEKWREVNKEKKGVKEEMRMGEGGW